MSELEIEIWKPLIKHNTIIPDYYVSNLGRYKSMKYNKERILKHRTKIRNGRITNQDIDVTIPNDLFKDYNYRKSGNKCSKLTIPVHRGVIETFKPLDKYPPILIDDWEKTPKSAKDLICSCCIVDHIDDDPTNNKLSNLRWVTPRENNPNIKKHLFINL